MGIDIDNAIRVACSDANAQFVAMNLADDTIEIISRHYAYNWKLWDNLLNSSEITKII